MSRTDCGKGFPGYIKFVLSIAMHRCRNEILIGGGGHLYGKEWLSVYVGENFE